MTTLEIKNLHASVDGKPILQGVNLTLHSGELHALMGPNGSGKSTLALTLLGHPRYTVTDGEILLNGENITSWPTEKRAQAGLFLSMQHPPEVAGVPYAQFLRTAYHALHQPAQPVPFEAMYQQMTDATKAVALPEAVLERSMNEGFSGGEKKRAEILQLQVLQPKVAILDEPDSGLDLDALKAVGAAIQAQRSDDRIFLVVTHYPRLLNYIAPDAVHVFAGGKVVQSGSADLANQLEREGYDQYVKEAAK